jgi:hypothetical protein
MGTCVSTELPQAPRQTKLEPVDVSLTEPVEDVEPVDPVEEVEPVEPVENVESAKPELEAWTRETPLTICSDIMIGGALISMSFLIIAIANI